jgi:hypothetical protein
VIADTTFLIHFHREGLAGQRGAARLFLEHTGQSLAEVSARDGRLTARQEIRSMLKKSGKVVPATGIKVKHEAGICVNHRFLPVFNSSAPVNGSFLLQDRLARANTSPGSGGS